MLDFLYRHQRALIFLWILAFGFTVIYGTLVGLAYLHGLMVPELRLRLVISAAVWCLISLLLGISDP